MSPEQMAREFYAARNVQGGLAPPKPTIAPPDVRELRLALMDEEVAELHEAVEAGDLGAIADALTDIEYVARGTAVVYGIPSDAVFAEVHRSNMTKEGNPETGKLVKGPEYEPPRIAAILREAEAG